MDQADGDARSHRPTSIEHGIFMVWSYVGLVAAGLAQLGERMYGGTAVLYVSLVVVVVAGVIIHVVAPRVEQASRGAD